MKDLLEEIRNCRICEHSLEHEPRPVLSVTSESQIIIIGQAPGLIVHKSGVPWQDRSGDNLRRWMGVSDEIFYDPKRIGILPMGFCYPGHGTKMVICRHEKNVLHIGMSRYYVT